MPPYLIHVTDLNLNQSDVSSKQRCGVECGVDWCNFDVTATALLDIALCFHFEQLTEKLKV